MNNEVFAKLSCQRGGEACRTCLLRFVPPLMAGGSGVVYIWIRRRCRFARIGYRPPNILRLVTSYISKNRVTNDTLTQMPFWAAWPAL
jgi:hypothetical protein